MTKQTINVDGDKQTWHLAHQRRRHDCQDGAPLAPAGGIDDKWVCPICNRRWRLVFKTPNDGKPEHRPTFANGVTIAGRDGSIYWRAFRARFVGALSA